MGFAIGLTRAGGPEVLQVQPIVETQPGAGEVWIEHEAIGVNCLDVTQRNGSVPIPLPSGLGLEGAGRVTVVGPGIDNFAVGDRVAYILGHIGSYATGRLYPANRLVRLPREVSAEHAATVMLKGITAQYLLHSTFSVGPGTVVSTGRQGTLGQIMAPWAKSLGAFVIGVVSKEASVARAKAAGCDAVLVWDAHDIPTQVAKLTDGRKADVVYDGIGKLTFAASLDSLRPRGLMVSIGASSGTPDPVAVSTLKAKGSLFLTRPGLAAHSAELGKYHQRADAVLSDLTAGIIKPATWEAFPLCDAATAHADLESGKSAGAIVLKP